MKWFGSGAVCVRYQGRMSRPFQTLTRRKHTRPIETGWEDGEGELRTRDMKTGGRSRFLQSQRSHFVGGLIPFCVGVMEKTALRKNRNHLGKFGMRFLQRREVCFQVEG